MEKKLSQLKKIVKNVDSLIENKFSPELEKKESCNIHKSADSLKFSEQISEKHTGKKDNY